MSDFRSVAPSAGSAADAPVSRPVLLRQSREAAGLHIAALAAALKVPVKKLEALEAGRYEALPDMTFARALASSACRQLKIDPAPVLEQIPAGYRPQLGDSPQAINTPFKHAQDPAPMNPMGWLSRPAVLGAIALLMGALVLVFMPDMQISSPANSVSPPAGASNGPATVNEPVSAVLPTEPPPVAEVAVPAATVPLGTSASAAAALSATPEATEPAPASSVSLVDTATQVATPGSLLSIAATGESWIEVVNGSGRVVMQRVLRPGELIEFSTAPPYSVVLGRADAARVSVRGQPFDVMPYARNSVARFEVK